MKKISIFLMLLMGVLLPWAATAQSSLTVCSGTVEEQHIPIYAYSGDTQGTTSEFIIPESNLTNLNGKEITALTFYLSQSQSKTWTANYQVYMAQVATTQLTRTIGPDAGTIVYEGTVDASGSEMTITFNQGHYTYNGGNLLIGTYVETAGAWDANGKFYGITASSAAYLSGSWGGYDDGAVDFIPTTTFTYLTNDPYITLAPASATVFTNSTQTLTATYGNVSGTPSISYTSSNTSVATVTGSGTTATVTGVAPGTATITATMNGSYTATCAVTVEDPSYCTPSYSETSDYIKSFVTTGGNTNISNTNTSQGTGGYSDFYSSHSASIEPGETLSFTVTRGYSDSYKYAIWVDWNHDYVFDVSTETVAQQTTSVSRDWSGSFTVPAGTAAGDYHMRVEMLYGSSSTLNPCVSASYGEVEDYKLTVLAVSGCPRPSGIADEPFWETANISWTGTNNSYAVRYRTAETEQLADGSFFEDFENGLGDWTLLVLDEGSGWNQFDPSQFEYTAHSGQYVALTQSYGGQSVGDINADNWMISPQITLQRTMTFWAMGDATYPEGFSVCVSTSGTDERDFTAVQTYTENPSDWTMYTVDLSSYAGRTGYIAFHHEQYGGDFLFIDDVLVGSKETVPAGAWLAPTDSPTTNNYIEITGLSANTEYEYQVMGFCDGSQSDWSSILSFTTLSDTDKHFVNAGSWAVAANWMPQGAPTANCNVTIKAAATIPSGCDAVANEITIDGGSITIQDGGQLHTNSALDNVTIEKNINGYSSTKDNYYLIASPLNLTSTTISNVQNLRSGTYDFYTFDGTQELEWINQNTNYNSSAITTMGLGTGYLYANAATTTLSFTGAVRAQLSNFTYNGTTLTYSASADAAEGDFTNWHLVGNFLPHNGYPYLGTVESGYVVYADEQNFYSMGNGRLIVAENDYVKPAEGIFVEATAASQYVFWSSESHTAKSANLSMNVSYQGILVDRAVLRFGEGQGLGKFQLNPNHTKIYMPVNGKDFAVVYTDAQNEMPVNFKAEENGSYTISFNTENVELGYLHLIDNMTGNDVDLLATPSYSFNAKSSDYESRFKLVFATGNNANDDNFAFFSNGSFVINNEGEATLQVIDINGRILKSESINGCANVNVKAAAGVYMLRLVNGNDVKVQKVVVR